MLAGAPRIAEKAHLWCDARGEIQNAFMLIITLEMKKDRKRSCRVPRVN